VSGDQGLAQPPGGVDDHPVTPARDRVGAEGHPRRVRDHQALDEHGEREAVLRQSVVAPVGERGVAPQRGPGALDRLEHGVEADHPEDRLVLAREGGGRAVLVERRGAHRDGCRRCVIADEARVRVDDGAAELRVDAALALGAPVGLGGEAEARRHRVGGRERAQVGRLRADERGVGGAGIAEGEDEWGQLRRTTWVIAASGKGLWGRRRQYSGCHLTMP
jgi:hypothetical protein